MALRGLLRACWAGELGFELGDAAVGEPVI
jgi:hypothetical protein